MLKKDEHKSQFVEQTKTDSCLLRRAQLYAPYQCIAFVLLHKETSTQYRMLVFLLMDITFLDSPSTTGAFCISQIHPDPRSIR